MGPRSKGIPCIIHPVSSNEAQRISLELTHGSEWPGHLEDNLPLQTGGVHFHVKKSPATGGHHQIPSTNSWMSPGCRSIVVERCRESTTDRSLPSARAEFVHILYCMIYRTLYDSTVSWHSVGRLCTTLLGLWAQAPPKKQHASQYRVNGHLLGRHDQTDDHRQPSLQPPKRKTVSLRSKLQGFDKSPNAIEVPIACKARRPRGYALTSVVGIVVLVRNLF